MKKLSEVFLLKRNLHNGHSGPDAFDRGPKSAFTNRPWIRIDDLTRMTRTMKYLKIFFLYNQRIFEQRAKSLIFFLSTLVNPLLLLLLWIAAFKTNKVIDWSLPDAASYYLLLVTTAAFLMSFVEESVGKIDIAEGQLTSYMLKPFSYFWLKYFEEAPYRILQGIYALSILSIFFITFNKLFVISNSPITILLSLVIAILGYHIAFSFKFIIGLLGFWMTELAGLFNVVEIAIYIFGGYVMPLTFLPPVAASIAYFTPFPYIIYYPVVALQGKLSVTELIHIINVQIIWLCLLALIYKYVWNKGKQLFTSFGQ